VLSKWTANLSLKLLSLAVAVVLWFAVLGSRNVEVNKEVPIEVVTPTDLVVANDVPDRVSFRLSGPKAFLRNILNRREEPIRINFSTAKAGLVTYRFFQDNIQVPLGVKVLSINPVSVVVKLESLKRKDVPVRLVTTGETPQGYRLTKLALLRHTVRLKGAESKLDAVSEVATQPVDLNAMLDSGEREAILDLSKHSGVSVDGELPRIEFQVVQSTANFKIRNADVRVVTQRRYEVNPKEVTIYVRCSPEDLRQLDRNRVYGVVQARDKTPGTHELPLSVQLPSNIKLIKVLPQKVKVTLY
jgi:YbbR domain-containing protein